MALIILVALNYLISKQNEAQNLSVLQLAQIKPGYFAPSNFAKDAFKKDESVIFGNKVSAFFQLFEIQKFCVFAKLQYGWRRDNLKNHSTANFPPLMILKEFKNL